MFLPKWNITLYTFDKVTGFTGINEKDAIPKTEEQIGKSNVTDHNPTLTLPNKFKKTS